MQRCKKVASRCARCSVHDGVPVNYLGIFVGGIVSGWLGRYYESLPPSAFWLLHALIGIAGGVVILLLKRWFLRELRLT